jgi:capsular exopolysaccharide synthesis family protein
MEKNNNNEIDVRKIVRIVMEKWYWFAISVVFFVLLGVAYFLRKSPQWTTDASIMIRQKDGGLADQLGSLAMFGLGGSTAVEDEVVVLTSRGLMTQALDALNLWEASFVKDGIRWSGEFRNPALTIDYLELSERGEERPFIVYVKPMKKGYKVRVKSGFFHRSSTKVASLNEPVETLAGTLLIHPNRELSRDTTYRVIHKRPELVVAGFRKMLMVTLHKKESNIINLSMKSPMPDRDRALLHQLIEQYNLNAIVDKNMLASNTGAFIEERMNIITAELSEAEKTVSQYKEKNKIANIETQARLILEANSVEQQALAEIETQLNLVDYIDEFMHNESKQGSLIPANIGITDAALGSSLSQYNSIMLQRMRIQRTATANNPVLEQMDAQLSSMRQNIIATIASVRESLRIRKRDLQAQDSKFNRQIQNAPEQEREYVRIVRDQKIKEQLYLFLYKKREENALMLAATTIPAKVVDVPQCDVRSRSPKLKNLLVLCFMLGLMFPAALLYIYTLLNDKIDDVKDYERRVKAPMLGEIVQNSRHAHIAIREGESTVSAELFRLMRTNLRFVISSEVKSPVILVTSCINGEGKSYISCNIALSLAILGKKVALVGMDIRKPMIAQYFGLSQRGHLTDYLAEPSVTIDDIIVPSGEHKNLDLLPCGTIPPNPAELLQSKRVEELFAELRKRYDYIIVDTAPLALVSDTYLLDRIADLTILVSRFKYTPMEMVDYLNRIVELGRMHHVACVLNGTKSSRTGYGYGVQES